MEVEITIKDKKGKVTHTFKGDSLTDVQDQMENHPDFRAE